MSSSVLPAAAGLGAVPADDGSCSFVVWAPALDGLQLVLVDDGGTELRRVPLQRAGEHHRVVVDGVGHGSRYRFALGSRQLPDPASRWQPDGVDGPSAVFDASRHRWHDSGFRPPPRHQLVIYQFHVGTFTAAGTLDGAIDDLDRLAELGVTALEPLPLCQFPGHRNWGYDGVFPWSVHHGYGGPAALQRFVDAAHQRGLAVLLDAVYNHFGPEGNVLPAYGPYLTDAYRTPWGDAVNVAGAGSDEVRRFFIDSARWWMERFHVDGLRVDAIHGIVDPTARPFLRELSEATAALAAELGRPLLLIAESADNDPRTLAPSAEGGLGFDAQWNDDFHHALRTLITPERRGYYQDFGAPDQLATALADGFVFQGQYNRSRGRRHGDRPRGLVADQLVVFDQNHDQIGNRPRGERLTVLVPAPAVRLAAAATLLAANVPLVFMGEEYGETAPFPYFIDHRDPTLVEAVRRGRAAEMGALWDDDPLDPADPATFAAARLQRSLRHHLPHARREALFRRLLQLRRTHPAFAAPWWLTAHAEGRLLTVVRRGGARPGAAPAAGPAEAVVLLNFADASADTTLPGDASADTTLPGDTRAGGGTWHRLLDGADADLGGEGPAAPTTVGSGGGVALGAYGFVVYGRPGQAA